MPSSNELVPRIESIVPARLAWRHPQPRKMSVRTRATYRASRQPNPFISYVASFFDAPLTSSLMPCDAHQWQTPVAFFIRQHFD